jgi:hypothetical protein
VSGFGPSLRHNGYSRAGRCQKTNWQGQVTEKPTVFLFKALHEYHKNKFLKLIIKRQV